MLFAKVKQVGLIVSISLGFFLLSCASIVSGTKQKINISSSPSAAKVKVERAVAGGVSEQTVWEGQTPATVELKRKYEYVVTISAEGYKDQRIVLERSTNGWVWGNLLFGGIFGIIIDFSNGAGYKLTPKEIHVELATAYLPDGRETAYAMIHLLDNEGRPVALPVPLVPIQK
ncbi:MAG: hypothetical protein D6681_16650 [Calditrichaeota bacterium]|nr:MAG: hypothetical protein D6681_16650 [Calditrichota bacterium]